VIGFLLAAPLALAAERTQLGGYPGGGVAGGAEGPPVTSGQLPFTGLNLVLLVVGGTLLIALGVALTLRGRSRNAAG
jgi:hypothetical protein